MAFSLFKKKKSVAGYKLNWISSPPDPRESELILMGHEMGLNTDIKKTKAQNAAIVAGGLGIK